MECYKIPVFWVCTLLLCGGIQHSSTRPQETASGKIIGGDLRRLRGNIRELGCLYKDGLGSSDSLQAEKEGTISRSSPAGNPADGNLPQSLLIEDLTRLLEGTKKLAGCLLGAVRGSTGSLLAKKERTIPGSSSAGKPAEGNTESENLPQSSPEDFLAAVLGPTDSLLAEKEETIPGSSSAGKLAEGNTKSGNLPQRSLIENFTRFLKEAGELLDGETIETKKHLEGILEEVKKAADDFLGELLGSRSLLAEKEGTTQGSSPAGNPAEGNKESGNLPQRSLSGGILGRFVGYILGAEVGLIYLALQDDYRGKEATIQGFLPEGNVLQSSPDDKK